MVESIFWGKIRVHEVPEKLTPNVGGIITQCSNLVEVM